MSKDFLDEMLEARAARNPHFKKMVSEAEMRRTLARQLAQGREKLGLSQTAVAARMGTSASVVSKLESGVDVKQSTIMKYCIATRQAYLFDPRKFDSGRMKVAAR